MKTLKVPDYYFGGTDEVVFYVDEYTCNDGAFIGALLIVDGEIEEPYGDVTVNGPWEPVNAGEVALDTSNSKALIDAMIAANLLTLTGDSRRNGYNTYPVATVNTELLKEYMYVYEEG